MTQGWILDILAAVMLLVAALSAARLLAVRAWRQPGGDADIDVAHLLMGVAMAGMLATSLTTLPSDAWDVIFAVMTGWFGWRVYREARGQGARVLADGHHVPHLVHSAAMLYMFVALSGPARAGSGGAMSGMGGGSAMAMPALSVPVVAFIFALWLCGYAVLDLDRLSGPGHGHGSYFAVPALAPPGPGRAGPAGAALAGATAGRGPASLAGADGAGGAGPAPERAAGSEPGSPAVTGGPARPGRGFLAGPQVAAGCRIVMGVTMAFMLIIMI